MYSNIHFNSQDTFPLTFSTNLPLIGRHLIYNNNVYFLHFSHGSLISRLKQIKIFNFEKLFKWAPFQDLCILDPHCSEYSE